MKRVLLFVSAVLLAVSCISCKKDKTVTYSEPVTLTFASWRPDDVAQMNALFDLYHQQFPYVTIVFEPVNPPDYNDYIAKKLESGATPDLLCTRSFAKGYELYASGYLSDCTGITGIKEAFSEQSRSAWTSPDGKLYALPFAAVSHAMYYNKDIFEKEKLAIPKTWENFLAVCTTLKAKGYVPLANGLADEWDILECFFLGGVIPDFVGGSHERERYEQKKVPLNDENFVAAYQAMSDIEPFLFADASAVSYDEAKKRFSEKKAVMYMDGSWSSGLYASVDFAWGIFALPAPKERSTVICFHPDMAISINAKSPHQKESRAFLAWLCTVNGAKTVADCLPSGYFPMNTYNVPLSDANASRFLLLNKGKDIDARFIWPKLIDLYTPMNKAVVAAIKGEMTAQEAADYVAAARK